MYFKTTSSTSRTSKKLTPCPYQTKYLFSIFTTGLLLTLTACTTPKPPVTDSIPNAVVQFNPINSTNYPAVYHFSVLGQASNNPCATANSGQIINQGSSIEVPHRSIVQVGYGIKNDTLICNSPEKQFMAQTGLKYTIDAEIRELNNGSFACAIMIKQLVSNEQVVYPPATTILGCHNTTQNHDDIDDNKNNKDKDKDN